MSGQQPSLALAQGEVAAVAGIMRDNMGKLLEREGKLGDLELRADQLQAESHQFRVCLAFLTILVTHRAIILTDLLLVTMISLDHVVPTDLALLALLNLAYLAASLYHHCRRRQ